MEIDEKILIAFRETIKACIGLKGDPEIDWEQYFLDQLSK